MRRLDIFAFEHAARYFLMRRKDKTLPKHSKLDPLG